MTGGGTAGTSAGAGGSGGTTASTGGTAAGAGGAGAGGGGAGGLGGAGGVGGAGGSGGAGGGMCTGDIMTKSSGAMHTHTLTVMAADITAGVAKKIQSSTDQQHSHWVEITAQDFVALKAGMEVKKTSCNNSDHQWVLKCGGGGSMPVLPTMQECPMNSTCGDGMSNTCP
jgi:hypothetical protein